MKLLARNTCAILLMVGLFPLSTTAGVKINEFKVKPTGTTSEWIELYNPDTVDVDVTGWTLHETGGSEVLSGVIPAGGFMVINTGLGFAGDGDVISIRDDMGTLIDDVG